MFRAASKIVCVFSLEMLLKTSKETKKTSSDDESALCACFKYDRFYWSYEMKTEFVPRVNQVNLLLACLIFIGGNCCFRFQLDAIQLDNDISRIIKEQLISSLQNVNVSGCQHRNPNGIMTVFSTAAENSAISPAGNRAAPPHSFVEFFDPSKCGNIRTAVALHLLRQGIFAF